jgi:beta-glucosidase
MTSEILLLATLAGASIYHDSWIDLNKNGRMDAYEDRRRPTEERVEDLLHQMSLEEKSCQLATLYGYGRVLADELPTAEWKNRIWKDGIANIDEHLNSIARNPKSHSSLSYPYSKHASAINQVQRFFIEETRLGIPVDFTNEGIRGLCHDRATSFPSQLGLASSWDVSLVEAVGKVTGVEARALGYTNVYSPILDLPRDPRWGRTVECYSEDPYLTATLGRTMVEALQHQHVVSTPKHFAVYSVPKGGRDGSVRTDPEVTAREVETLYLAPFRAAIQDAGALGVMSSYNDYDGVPITGSPYFLTDVLRRRWGFKGYVVSDSKAVEFIETKHHVARDYADAVRQAVVAGLNVRTEFTEPDVYIGAVRELVRDGRLPIATVDDRVRDVLRVKLWLGLFDEPYNPRPETADTLVRTKEHLDIALRAARESIVLLKNDADVLPLKKAYKKILVTGPGAAETESSVSRYGPSNLPVVSVLEGIRKKVGAGVDILYTKGCEFADRNFPESEIVPVAPDAAEQAEIDKAGTLAAQADAAVVVLGENEELVGESRSRTSLELPGFQERLVEAVHASGKPTIVVLTNGRPLSINWIQKHVPAVVEAWFQGELGGVAVADVLFGDYAPTGKLPITFPKSVGQIPLNFPYKRGSQVDDRDLSASERKTGVNGPLYAFGHGLSYTRFTYGDLAVTPQTAPGAAAIKVTFTVQNAGDRAGDEIAQLYVSQRTSSVVTYASVLRGFARVSLQPGEKKTVTLTLTGRDLEILNREGKWTVEPGPFDVLVGSSSVDIRLRGGFEVKG